jgi:hypothetical protein
MSSSPGWDAGTGRCKPGTRDGCPASMPARTKPKPVIEPGLIEGADLLAAITGLPSVYAEASLEAECWRLAHGAGR